VAFNEGGDCCIPQKGQLSLSLGISSCIGTHIAWCKLRSRLKSVKEDR